ncbi:TatD family hydrolase [Aerococcus kribbianus]|uniref:TatD family hydrolase n=1 Tax=Aerococcus kribbianus TaxID=2999064 RepID=A0A9X3FW47_9LACT|nr:MULTISPECIES: TatD family hydrolase [unclassified Aerococcus]MCZ0717314.1 TatD family hydrolase [Aerococcus sp. YH-aer221]MCZ0725602.1 TatD family hydrolase [Aerococcus sp. YH-aer222]
MTKPTLFDTHTHLNVNKFKGDRQEVTERARLMGVSGFAVVGFDYPTIDQALKMATDNQDMVAIIGWHPTEAHTFDRQAQAYLEANLTNDRVVALGETGLDYYWKTAPKEDQEEAFRRQLAMARDHQLPVVVHNRDATADCYRILKEERVGDFGGIMHSFSEGSEWAQKFLDLGMRLSFSGTVSYQNAQDIQAACQLTPDNCLLIETDAPYLAPHPKRGLRNETGFVYYVASAVAKLRATSLDDLAQLTYNNACQLFNLQATKQGLIRNDKRTH